MITNKMKTVQLKMIEARFWPKTKFETIFFQVLWQFFNPKGSLLRAGGRGGWGEFRPPYKFWAKSVRIFSNAHRQFSEFGFWAIVACMSCQEEPLKKNYPYHD